MGEIHKLLDRHGKQEVLKFDVDRRVVEAASTYMTTEDGEIGFLYSGWAQSGLPHKRLADDASWQVRTDHVSLLGRSDDFTGVGWLWLRVGRSRGSWPRACRSVWPRA